jgi:hypothetical protein
MIAKCASAAEENHLLAIAIGLYTREVAFYREAAKEIDLPVPLPYHVDTSETGVPFVLLITGIQGANTP